MKIVVCYDRAESHIDEIKHAAPDCVVIKADQTTVASLIGEADIFCGHAKVPIDWARVVRRGQLKWIQSSAAGLDHCLVDEVCDSQIIVTSASGLFSNQVAEQTMALLFGLIRGLPKFFQAKLQRSFTRQPTDDLHGKTIGLLGFGGNGQRIAELLRPVDCRLIAADRFAKQWNHEFDLPPIDQLFDEDGIDELLSVSEVVILTLPLLNNTIEIISQRELNLMPAGRSYLINVGRGQLVNERALVSALNSGHLLGAGLDVAATEPLPADSPLWDLPNVIITPHVGAQSRHRAGDVTRLFCENLARFLNGQKLKNVVDKNVGFPLPRDRH